jgi:nucleotide-binding universal stress UspA family protein
VQQAGNCVVATVDFSDGALRAVREGRWLAQRAGLSLQVLHVTAPGAVWRPEPRVWNWLREAAVDPSTLLVRRGLAWVEIVRHAKEVEAAFLVLGSHGASGPQSVTLGSTASQVALRAGCPVLFATSWRGDRHPDEVPVPSIHPPEALS